MEAADWHTFQVLTKRSSLMVRYLRNRYGCGTAPSHIWLGVSIEDAKNAVRLKHLRAAQGVREIRLFRTSPGSVGKVDLKGIDWAIVGGESGPQARPMAEEWAIEIRDQCRAAKVAFSSNSGAGFGQSLAGVSFAGANGMIIPTCRRENSERHRGIERES